MSTLYAIGKDIIGTQYSPNPNSNSVSVVGDGVKTYKQELNTLCALIDTDRITENSVIELQTSQHSFVYLNLSSVSLGYFYFSESLCHMSVAASSVRTVCLHLTESLMESVSLDGTYVDESNFTTSDGFTITLYYNDQPSYTTSMLADNVKYDNTQSGLSATDVQGAVDEIAVKNYTFDYSNVQSLTKGVNFYAPKDGYVRCVFAPNTSTFGRIDTSDNTALIMYQAPSSNANYTSLSTFVKKGMLIVWNDTSNNIAETYTPVN